jgi:uncharacterized protein YecA (UPF0149 family)
MSMAALHTEVRTAFPESEAMRRLRAYDRMQARPGVQVVNIVRTRRNDLCPCGSERKFKKCCGKR